MEIALIILAMWIGSGILAARYNRIWIGYMIVGLFVSPIIILIVLLCLGKKNKA